MLPRLATCATLNGVSPLRELARIDMNSASSPDNAVDWVVRRRRLDSILRLQAAAVCGDPAHEEAVRVLAEALGDPVPDMREIAIGALHEYGPDARGALRN